MNDRANRVLEYDKIINMLCDYTVSQSGRKLASELLPDDNINNINFTLQLTEEAESVLINKGYSPIDTFDDITTAINRLKVGSVLSASELLRVARFQKACQRAKTNLYNDNSSTNLSSYAERLTIIKQIMEDIFMAIISEEEFSDNASPTLYQLRKRIKSCHQNIKDKLNHFLRSADTKKYLQDALITMRGDRYVLPVKAEYRPNVPGIVHDQSSTGATLFIEPMSIVEINNDLRTLYSEEQAEIERILQEFSFKIEPFSDEILEDFEIMTQLDFIFAKAKLSKNMRAIRPEINERGYVNIKNGRHPLLAGDKVVPINLWLGDSFNVLVITGPNTGGKTVTLKTIGLFTLMTQAGLFIPADIGSSIAVFDKVFADIGDEQSIEQSLSTFSSHMINIADIVKHATSDSLVLFDELGAGTDPTEGAALAISILEEFRMRKTRTVATTHYSELKEYSITKKQIENASMEFDVASLRPTYRILVGIPGKSNAFLISQNLGLPEYIIDRASTFISTEAKRFEDVLTRAEQYRQDAEKALLEANDAILQAKALKKQEEHLQADLKAKREAIIEKAKEDANKILLSAKQESKEIISSMKEMMRDQSDKSLLSMHATKKKLDEKIANNINSYQKQATDGLVNLPVNKIIDGTECFVGSIAKTGTIISKPNQKGEVKVQVGIIQINVKQSDLYENIKPAKKSVASYKTDRKSMVVPLSLDLRGQTSDEAIMNIDMYLDQAFISNLHEVTLIHGKGTGALRKAISGYLYTNSHVKSHRLGKYGEGDAGVTVVELKET